MWMDLALLWLWCRLAAVALIQLLAWEGPYAVGAALKKQKKKNYGLEWINNKVLMYHTGNYIQSPGIDHMMENNIKKESCVYMDTHMYMTESLCCAAEIGTTLIKKILHLIDAFKL